MSRAIRELIFRVSGPHEQETSTESVPVVPLCPVDIDKLVQWVERTNYATWPQQKPLRGEMRPAMPSIWFDEEIGRLASALIPSILGALEARIDVSGRPLHVLYNTEWLSVVMPGHAIPRHIDNQIDAWVCRVHVPITSNPNAVMDIGDVEAQLLPGLAYAIDTTKAHEIRNDGETPRVHFMFDVVSPE